jgi:hypothetical protein
MPAVGVVALGNWSLGAVLEPPKKLSHEVDSGSVYQWQGVIRLALVHFESDLKSLADIPKNVLKNV